MLFAGDVGFHPVASGLDFGIDTALKFKEILCAFSCDAPVGRDRAVSANGRDLNSLAIEEAGLRADVDFASRSLQSARLAADNSRRESQRQQKFVVVLSQPQLSVSPDQNWRWQGFLASIGVVVVAWGVGGFILKAMRTN